MRAITSRRTFELWLTVFSLLSLLTAGCGPGKPSAVSGNVTFDGASVETGNIRFDPLEDTPGFGASTRITNGAYEIPAEDGLYAGTYMVSISATRPTGRTITGEGLPGEANTIDEVEQFVPPHYNTDSELRADLSPGSNRQDFSLLAQP